MAGSALDVRTVLIPNLRKPKFILKTQLCDPDGSFLAMDSTIPFLENLECYPEATET